MRPCSKCGGVTGIVLTDMLFVLQVIADRPDKKAKSTTKEEFIDQFRCIKAYAQQRMPGDQQPLFSFDNLSTQKYADLADLGLDHRDRLPLAPNMPDAHQIVEHCFAGFKPWFLKKVYATEGTSAGPQQLQQLLKAEWASYGQYLHQKGSLKRNADSLPATLEAIFMPEVAYLSSVDGKVRVGSYGGWVQNPLS